MADEQVIVTRFVADTANFEAGIDTVTKGLAEAEGASKNLDKAEKSLTTTTTALATTTTTLADKFSIATEEAKKTAAETGKIAVETQKTGGILQRVGKVFADFGKGARDGFRTAIKEVGGFSGITSQLGAKFKGFGATASNAFKSVSSSVQGAVGGIPLIGGLATALGPVGIAAAAVAGGLFKVITNTDAGATALEGLGKTGGLVFDRVTGAVTGFFDELTNGTGIIGGVFDFLSGAVDVFINKLTPIGAIFEAISETSIFKALKEDFEFGQQIANQLDELQDKQLGVNEATAANEITIRANLAALRDTTKPVEERLRLADEITAIEAQNLELKKEQLTAELRILQAQAQRQQLAKGEVDDSLKKQISDINVALSNAEAESVSLTERVSARRAGIVQAELQKTEAARQKAIAARDKAEAEQAKKAEARAQAEAKLNETVAKLSQEAYERTLTDSEREVEAIKQRYDDLETVTLEGIQKLRDASPANEQSAITAREAELVIAIEKAKNEELAALEAERSEAANTTRDEALERLRTSLLSATELEREAVLTRLDEERALAEQNIDNLEERNAVIAELTKKAQEELTKIVSEEDQKRIEQEEASAQRRAQLAEQNAGLISGFAEQSIGIIAQAAAAGEDISKAAQKQLVTLLLDTLEKIILANAFQAQAISAGSPDPANVASGGTLGIIRGVILAGIVKALFGAAKAAITASYYGDPSVGSDGSKPTWSGRDGFLRRVHKGERIVTAKTNAEHYDAMQSMEDGKWDQYVDQNYIMPAIEALKYNDDEKAVRFVQSDMGQRMAASITLPRMFDKNIVESASAARKEQRRTNDLLAAMLQQSRPRRRNTRYI